MHKVGLVGVGRGSMLFEFCETFHDAKLTAICDNNPDSLKRAQKRLGDPYIFFTTDYQEFLKQDFDTVFLANYATQHAPFAIEAMKAGKDVISEVLPVETMAQAVELIECVEATGRKYAYAENYCYMPAVREMKERIQKGELGTFEYGEGEYMHNCETIWGGCTGGNPNHWRNTMSAFFYCTHSVGPLLHATGLRPVKVSGFECPFNARMERMGAKAGHTAVEMITLENGAILKSIHGVGCSRPSTWYSLYGSLGRMESAREDAACGDVSRIYVNLSKEERVERPEVETHIVGNKDIAELSHGGSDFICLHNAFEYFSGKSADVIDVYEAIDMWMPGFFGYLSALNDNRSEKIPDLRQKENRDLYRQDYRCTTTPAPDGTILPSYSKGTPEIPPEVYKAQKEAADSTASYLKDRPQLIMHWTNDGTPAKPISLPDGITIETLPERKNGAEDWLAIVPFGLTPPNQTKECFDFYLTNWPNFRPEFCYFLVSEGKAFGTITVILDYAKSEGEVHMVAMDSAYRGKGLGNVLNQIAVNTLKNEGMKTAHLTTDDWRYAAIRSYLTAGFVPDKSTEDYVKRWNSIMPIVDGVLKKLPIA